MRLFPTIRPNLHESWTHNRASISAWRWIGQKTLFSTGGEAVSDTGDQPASARTQQEDGEEQDTPRASQLQSASPPSSKLPLSPLMDPNLIAARQRYRTPKPAPSDELSAFSKKLKRNPFAQALATPVRQCKFTNLRLPEYFHLHFGLQRHPTTGKPWHLPKLAPTVRNDVADKGKDVHAQGEDGVSESQEVPGSLTSNTIMQQGTPLRTMMGTYFVAQRSTIQFISRLNLQQHHRFFPEKWKSAEDLNTRDVVWREDMDTYVLKLMRQDLMSQLQYLSSRPSGYIVGTTYQHFERHFQLGAALWLGAGNAESSTSVEGTGTDGEADMSNGSTGPPAYAMLNYNGRYIPLFNLQTLLGNKPLEKLREFRPSFRDEIAVIKAKQNTVKLQMDLWKVMGYLAGGV